jgi:arylsulfatase A-like enzyme
MTGKYPARTDTTEYFCGKRQALLKPAEYNCQLPLEEVTLAETFKAAGYATFFAGKWHLGPEGFYPEDQGFDVNRGGIQRGGPYGGRKYFSPYGNPKLEDGPDGEHLPDRLARETVAFMAAHREEPFLAFLSFYSVHTPLMAPKQLTEKYTLKRKTFSHEGPRWLAERARHTRQVQDHPVYAGMVESMDAAVGAVLDGIEELGIAENTIVIFFSDNGGLSTSEGHPTSNVPLRAGKGWMYEGGIREPCLVRIPGVTSPGTTTAVPINSIDFRPTLLEICGIDETVDDVDGISILPVLKDNNGALDRDAMYWHYPHYGNQGGAPSGAIRLGDWKLIQWFEDDSVELFNLTQDIGEQNNLAQEHPELVTQLRRNLSEWRRSVGANMPRPNPDFKPDNEATHHRNADKASQTGPWR